MARYILGGYYRGLEEMSEEEKRLERARLLVFDTWLSFKRAKRRYVNQWNEYSQIVESHPVAGPLEIEKWELSERLRRRMEEGRRAYKAALQVLDAVLRRYPAS